MPFASSDLDHITNAGHPRIETQGDVLGVWWPNCPPIFEKRGYELVQMPIHKQMLIIVQIFDFVIMRGGRKEGTSYEWDEWGIELTSP